MLRDEDVAKFTPEEVALFDKKLTHCIESVLEAISKIPDVETHVVLVSLLRIITSSMVRGCYEDGENIDLVFGQLSSMVWVEFNAAIDAVEKEAPFIKLDDFATRQ